MKLFEAYWAELEKDGGASDKDKTRRGYEQALNMVLTRLKEGLAGANFDDNVGCITRLIRDVRTELDLQPEKCTEDSRDGFRRICLQECTLVQRKKCGSGGI